MTTACNSQPITSTITQQNNQGFQFQNSGLDHKIKIISGDLPLGWALDQNTKEKTWNNQYVDFSDLIDQGNQQNYAVSVDSESEAIFILTKNKKTIKSIKELSRPTC